MAGQGRILVVDDEPEMREMLREQLGLLGYWVTTADSAEAALAILDGNPFDLVLTDVRMGGMSGIELCARLKGDPRFQLTPVLILTAVDDQPSRVAGLAAGADDFFAKPCDFVELRTRVAALLRMKTLLDQLERAEGVLTALASTIEARDPCTGDHCERLAASALALGRTLGADEPTLRALRLGGYLHDLGKIAVPDAILLKPGPLDADERKVMQAHPVVGASLLRGLRSLDSVRPIIRHHHERWDGSGYPGGLEGEAIPFGARVLAVVDVYDALRTERPYRKALSPAEAVATLRRETEAGSWDPRIAMTFMEMLHGPAHVPSVPAGARRGDRRGHPSPPAQHQRPVPTVSDGSGE